MIAFFSCPYRILLLMHVSDDKDLYHDTIYIYIAYVYICVCVCAMMDNATKQ